MPRYRLSSEAQNDIRAIRDYYVETAGARVARHVVTEIDRACRFFWRKCLARGTAGKT